LLPKQLELYSLRGKFDMVWLSWSIPEDFVFALKCGHKRSGGGVSPVMTLVVARSLSFPNRRMLESYAQLAAAAKSLEL
jgi:hypothetical protein